MAKSNGNTEKRGPERVFRVGLVSASVFANEVDSRNGETRTMRSAVLQRRYQDADGNWQGKASFALGDIANAIRVLSLAQTYIEAQEADQGSE